MRRSRSWTACEPRSRPGCIELGLDDLVPELDDNLFGAAIDERVPDATQEQMGRMLEIGGPMAVFVVPVDTPEP